MAGQAEASPRSAGADFWAGRHEDINAFERHLDRNGTKVVKFFLNVSKAEQKRAHWDHYLQAFEEAVTATSTPWAPWYVVPADHKPVMQAMAAAILVDTIHSLDLGFPEVSEQARAANAEAGRRLAAEPEEAA
jgi:polyphosphate kinase 2 (PPK2 family)